MTENWILSDWIGILIYLCFFLHNHSLSCLTFRDFFPLMFNWLLSTFYVNFLQFSIFCNNDNKRKIDFTPTCLLVPTQIIRYDLSILFSSSSVSSTALGLVVQTSFFFKLKIFSLNWKWRGFVTYYISYIKHCMCCVTTRVSRWNWFNNFKDLTHTTLTFMARLSDFLYFFILLCLFREWDTQVCSCHGDLGFLGDILHVLVNMYVFNCLRNYFCKHF